MCNSNHVPVRLLPTRTAQDPLRGSRPIPYEMGAGPKEPCGRVLRTLSSSTLRFCSLSARYAKYRHSPASSPIYWFLTVSRCDYRSVRAIRSSSAQSRPPDHGACVELPMLRFDLALISAALCCKFSILDWERRHLFWRDVSHQRSSFIASEQKYRQYIAICAIWHQHRLSSEGKMASLMTPLLAFGMFCRDQVLATGVPLYFILVDPTLFRLRKKA